MKHAEINPQVIVDGGERIVVDEHGDELVIRRRNGYADRIYHLPHPVAAAHGYPVARCAHGRKATSAGASEWLWRQEQQLNGHWSLCGHCASDDPDTIVSNDGGSQGLGHKILNNDEFADRLNESLGKQAAEVGDRV